MIVKSFEIKKISLDSKIFLIYGENDGLKKEIRTEITKQFQGKVVNYDEGDIVKNFEEFTNLIKNHSLFEDKKIITINRCTEKISEIIFEIIDHNVDDVIFINSGILEKKSKLRIFFEKSNEFVIIPTYKDEHISLIRITRDFFLKNKISISQETVNLLVNRCNGDRGYLRLELDKIYNYLLDKKSISLKEIYTLTNLSENYTAAEIVDSSLAKNFQKTCSILNESNYSQEDAFLILRIFLQKCKRILSILDMMNAGKNLDSAIQEHKPPIFWKDKPIIKQQIQLWTYEKIQKIISQINSLEVMIKKNNSLSIILLKDFIYEVINIRPNNSF